MGGAMKSILAKQAPHRSPWLPMRVRQEMQTGGRRRSARRPSIGRMKPAAPRALAGEAGGASRLNSASPIGMVFHSYNQEEASTIIHTVTVKFTRDAPLALPSPLVGEG
jgi:hypothetical protein